MLLGDVIFNKYKTSFTIKIARQKCFKHNLTTENYSSLSNINMFFFKIPNTNNA